MKMLPFDIETGHKIDEYKMSDLCELTQQSCCQTETEEDDSEKHLYCTYEGKFDLLRNQFVIFKEFCSGFVVYEYQNARKPPRILYKGSMFCPLVSRSHCLLL